MASAVAMGYKRKMSDPDCTRDTVAVDWPDWLADAKVRPDPVPQGWLPRDAVVARILSAFERPVSVVSAPAGYGKSTAVAAASARISRGDGLLCWLSLDGADNAAARLATYLAFSLSRSGVLETLPVWERSCDIRTCVHQLHNRIAAAGRRVLLVLDRLEVMNAAALAELLPPLLQDAPDNLHVCLITRRDHELDISRLEVAGAVARVPWSVLAFTLTELREGLAHALSPTEISDAYGLTEGWPVAVHALQDALARERDYPRLKQRLARIDAPLGRYVGQQVLADLEDRERDFLRDLALADSPTTDFVDALRGTCDARCRLHALRPLEGLLHTDRPDGGLALNPLLRTCLRHHLAVAVPEHLVELNLRAAAWHDARGDLVAAVRHCVMAGCPERAAAIIERRGGISQWLREGITHIRAALDILGDGAIDSAPRLLLLRCIVDIKDGRVFRAGQVFARAESRIAQRRGDATAISLDDPVEYELTLVDAYLAIYAGKRIRETSYQRLMESTRYIAPTDHDRRGFHYTLLCVIYLQHGDFANARHFAREAIPVFRQINSLYGETYIYFHAGDISFAEGDGEEAERHYRRGLSLARRHFSDDKCLRLLAHVLLVELLHELDRRDYSDAVCRSIPRELEAREAWFEIYAAGYCTASSIELREAGLASALRLLDRGQRYADRQQLGHLGNLLSCQRIDLLVRAGQVRRARAELDRSGFSLTSCLQPSMEGVGWRERDTAALAIGNLLLAEQRYGEALEAVRDLAEHARRQHHLRSLLRYTVLTAQALAGLGDRAAAMQQLESALRDAHASGFVRALLDAPPEFSALLAKFASSDAKAALRDFAEAILRRREGDGISDGPAATVSRREREVLQHLALGMSNKQIARALDVSDNTVRFHLKNLFSKLSVNNRTQAVQQALSCGLLPR